MNVITMAASSRKKTSTEDFIVERVEAWLIVWLVGAQLVLDNLTLLILKKKTTWINTNTVPPEEVSKEYVNMCCNAVYKRRWAEDKYSD